MTLTRDPDSAPVLPALRNHCRLDRRRRDVEGYAQGSQRDQRPAEGIHHSSIVVQRCVLLPHYITTLSISVTARADYRVIKELSTSCTTDIYLAFSPAPH